MLSYRKDIPGPTTGLGLSVEFDVLPVPARTSFRGLPIYSTLHTHRNWCGYLLLYVIRVINQLLVQGLPYASPSASKTKLQPNPMTLYTRQIWMDGCTSIFIIVFLLLSPDLHFLYGDVSGLPQWLRHVVQATMRSLTSMVLSLHPNQHNHWPV